MGPKWPRTLPNSSVKIYTVACASGVKGAARLLTLRAHIAQMRSLLPHAGPSPPPGPLLTLGLLIPPPPAHWDCSPPWPPNISSPPHPGPTLWKNLASKPPALDDVVVTEDASWPPPSRICIKKQHKRKPVIVRPTHTAYHQNSLISHTAPRMAAVRETCACSHGP